MSYHHLFSRYKLSPRYKQIINILGESNHPLRAVEIINLGIPSRTVYNILEKGQIDGVIKAIDSLYELTDKGKNYFHEIQDSKIQKILRKKYQNLTEIQGFFESESISERRLKFVYKRLFLRFEETILNMDSEYLSQLTLLYIAQHHPLIFFNQEKGKSRRNNKDRNLLNFIYTNFRAVQGDTELLESLVKDFKKRISILVTQIDSPKLIELKAKKLKTSFFILENDKLVSIVDSIMEDLILEKMELDLMWTIKNCNELITDDLPNDFLKFLKKLGLLDELITDRYNFKYSKKHTRKNFLKTINETIPLFISEVLCKQYFTRAPFSNESEERAWEALNSYIYRSAFLCEIEENPERALQIIEEGLKLYPNFYMLLVNQGIILGKLNRFSEGFQIIKKSIEFLNHFFNYDEEDYKIELINLLKLEISLLLHCNDDDGAFRVYRTLLKLDPTIISTLIFIKFDDVNKHFLPDHSKVREFFNDQNVKKKIELINTKIKNIIPNQDSENKNGFYYIFQYKQKLNGVERLSLYLWRMKAFCKETAVKIPINLQDADSLSFNKNFHKIDESRYYLKEESKKSLLRLFRKLRFNSGIYNLDNFLYYII